MSSSSETHKRYDVQVWVQRVGDDEEWDVKKEEEHVAFQVIAKKQNGEIVSMYDPEDKPEGHSIETGGHRLIANLSDLWRTDTREVRILFFFPSWMAEVLFPLDPTPCQVWLLG